MFNKITNSPLADKKYNNQETSIHHEINRLLLKHFNGTYQIIPDAPAGPTILFSPILPQNHNNILPLKRRQLQVFFVLSAPQ